MYHEGKPRAQARVYQNPTDQKQTKKEETRRIEETRGCVEFAPRLAVVWDSWLDGWLQFACVVVVCGKEQVEKLRQR